jgi:hypothetical protein
MAKTLGTLIVERVRQALAHARRREPLGDVEKKIEAVRAAARHELPTCDIDAMLEEIGRGRGTSVRP